MDLFKFIDKTYTSEDLLESLYKIGANECETLFIHSDIMFGNPTPGFKKKEYLNELYSILLELKVKNIVVPTFTYSFCNHEVYDVTKSKTSMGAFNEFIRKLDGRYRTCDPLLSLSVPDNLKSKFSNECDHSLGEGSGLDVLHHMDDVKFLFLGADMADCFTYVHYVEKMMNVPYRFDMRFDGEIIYPDGTVRKKSQCIHTVCKGVKLYQKYPFFRDEMERKGYFKKCNFGSSYIGCIGEKDAYREIFNAIDRNNNYFLEKSFESSEAIYEYTYDYRLGRITHC